jgi:hypothetical protein
MSTNAMSVGVDAPTPSTPSRVARSSWFLTFVLVALLTVARLPQVTAQVTRRVDEAIAAGQFQDTTQRPLAVNLGVAVALCVALVITLAVLMVARKLESRLRLPDVAIGGHPIPGVLLVVGSVLVTKQATCLVSGEADPRTSPLVWAAVLTAVASSCVLLARRCTTAAGVRRTALTGLALGAVAVIL